MGGLFSSKQSTNLQKPSSTNNHQTKSIPLAASQKISNPPQNTFQPVYQPIRRPVSSTLYEPSTDIERVMYTGTYKSSLREYQKPKETLQTLTKKQETKSQSFRNYQYYQPQSFQSNYQSIKYQNKKSQQIKPPDFDPYPGCQGRWVSHKEFTGVSKTFGFFKCTSCKKTWMSAHSKKQFKQACKSCNQYYLPVYLWVNDNKKYQKKDKVLVDNYKHHRSDLCEACQKGRCDQMNINKPIRHNSHHEEYEDYSYKGQQYYDYERDYD